MTIIAGADFGTLTCASRSWTPMTAPRWARQLPTIRCTARQPIRYWRSRHMETIWRRFRAPCARLWPRPASTGDEIAAFAADTTGSSVVVVDENLQPLDDYYLWCDHRAHQEAAEITALAREAGLEALDWCGGVYSHEWGFAKLLHFLRHNPDKRGARGDRARTLRHGGGDALRHHFGRRPAAQHLRHGAQMDVGRTVGRTAAAGFSGACRPASGRHQRQARRAVRNVERDRRPCSSPNGPRRVG